MQLFSSLAPTEESVPCSLYPKYLREAKNPRKSMKMRFYCQLAFATARLPCIQIRLPSQGRTERGWLQSRLAFVTRWLHLKEVHWILFKEVMLCWTPCSCPARSWSHQQTLKLPESWMVSSLSTSHPAWCSANSWSWQILAIFEPMVLKSWENKGALTQKLTALNFSQSKAGWLHPSLKLHTGPDNLSRMLGSDDLSCPCQTLGSRFLRTWQSRYNRLYKVNLSERVWPAWWVT